ncbi:uncharacterized protein LOC111608349 [Xiphophorus maculatus]|uniref:uncharacterized protein LOC111608349 n=1 Tax=Xiphophorus maculatus TaxID=8083 RepID=UPI000C6DBAB3|nr:uncharacterized protein LOC111608349 [Xiphophorus maculatus]
MYFKTLCCYICLCVFCVDMYPAKILARQRTVSEGSELYVTCSIFGQKKYPSFYVYLLKDGQGFRKSKHEQALDDALFIISNLHLDHSGNYSCLYSTTNYSLSDVEGKGKNEVEILVIANFIPAELSIAGPFTVHEGSHVEFKCTFSETLHTLNNCKLIYCYLKKNETILQIQVFNLAQMEASFSIEGAVSRDSGPYSCLLLPSKCFQKQWNELQGINTVILEVKEDLIPWAALSCGFTVLMLLFSLCLGWFVYKNCFKRLYKPCEQQNTDVLALTDVEPQEGSEEENSFSMESEEDSCCSTAASPNPQLHTDVLGTSFIPNVLPEATHPVVSNREWVSNEDQLAGPLAVASEPLTTSIRNSQCFETTRGVIYYSSERIYSVIPDDSSAGPSTSRVLYTTSVIKQ